MNRIEIKQQILNPPWPLVVAVLLLFTPFSIYWFTLEGTIEYGEDFWTIVFSSLFTAVIIGWAMSLKSHVIIDESGIKYKSSPLLREMKFISFTEIQKWEIIDYKPLKSKGLGFKRDLRGNRYYVMHFGKALCIELTSGNKFTFGIGDPSKVRRYIKANWMTKI